MKLAILEIAVAITVNFAAQTNLFDFGCLPLHIMYRSFCSAGCRLAAILSFVRNEDNRPSQNLQFPRTAFWSDLWRTPESGLQADLEWARGIGSWHLDANCGAKSPRAATY